MARQNDKRVRLVKGADQLFHQQGINTTTLADIAQLAEVPLGNVYYYFKSKDSIILAVIEDRLQTINKIFNELNSISDPKDRIKGLIDKWLQNNESIVNFGDPVGSLCLELSKQQGDLQKAVSNLMHTIITWCEEQFKGLNLANKDDAHINQLAMNLIAGLQGISLLGVTFKNLNNLNAHANFMLNWLNNLA